MHKILGIILFSTILFSCKQAVKKAEVVKQLTEDQIEAREDSIALANAYTAQKEIKISVTPTLETQIVDAKATDDAADDPAIWINPTDVTKSLVYGSNKKGGIATYDLSGKEIAYDAVGKVNNIDVIDGIRINGKANSILGGTNRSAQSIDLFHIDPVDGGLNRVCQFTVDPSLIDDIYGFCFAKDAEGNAYALINGKNGLMQQYKMRVVKDSIALSLVRSVQFGSQTEGMVADEIYGNLFVGQEDRGVWKLKIDPSSDEKTFIAQSEKTNNPMIRYDVEGITLLEDGEDGYLVVSSQGNFSYALFDRKAPHDYITSFKVSDGPHADGSEETDGLEINTTPIGEHYPRGIIVLQDGFNYDGTVLKPQNFKYVSVADLLKQMR